MSEKSNFTTVKKGTNYFFKFTPWIILIIEYIWVVCVNLINGSRYINADMSSEMVLANLLSKEGAWFVSKNWLYSTELRVLNIQLVYKNALKIFSDWNTARTASLAFLLLVLLLSYFFLAKQAKLKNLGVWAAVIFLLPLSDKYAFIVLIGNFYIPHIVISFLSLGLLLKLLNTGSLKKWPSIISAVLLLMLAFVSGLGGVRQMLVFFVPAFLTFAYFSYLDVAHNSKTLYGFDFINRFINIVTIVSFIALIFCTVGFLINTKFLTQRFSFVNYTVRPVIDFQLDAIICYLGSVVKIFGYQSGFSFFSIKGIQSITAIAFYAIILFFMVLSIKKRKSFPFNQQVVIVFSLTAFAFNIIINSLLGIVATNYMIPTTMFCIITLVVYFQNIDYQNVLSRLIPTSFILVILIVYFINPNIDIVYRDKEGNLNRAVEWLVNHEYKNGYATFWNGNISTELSDGELEIWALEDFRYCNKPYILEPYKALQKKAHIYEKPQGEFFILLSQYEYAQNPDYAKEENIVYNADGYYIFIYDSTDALNTGPE